MAIVNCNECGKEVSDKAISCPNCGAAVTTVPTEFATRKSNCSAKRKLPIIITAIGGIVLAVIVGIAVRITDGNVLTTGETKLASLRSELSSVSAELSSSKAQLKSIKSQLESQSKEIKPLEDVYDASLAAGTYTVGTDIAPGVYHFTYNLSNLDDAWGDCLYITYANSEGREETLGGTKYDFCVEAEEDGEQVAIKLDTGSKVLVEAEYGMWNPGKKPATSTEQ